MNAPRANPYGAVETEVMCLAVSEVIAAIVAVSGLGEDEVLDMLGRVGADTLNGMAYALAVGDFEPLAGIGAERLAAIFRSAILDVAALAEIEPDELARVVMHESGGSLAGILRWLRAGSARATGCGAAAGH